MRRPPPIFSELNEWSFTTIRSFMVDHSRDHLQFSFISVSFASWSVWNFQLGTFFGNEQEHLSTAAAGYYLPGSAQMLLLHAPVLPALSKICVTMKPLETDVNRCSGRFGGRIDQQVQAANAVWWRQPGRGHLGAKNRGVLQNYAIRQVADLSEPWEGLVWILIRSSS